MPTCLLGIDIGTGGIKVAVINNHGEVLSHVYKELPLICEKPGWAEHNSSQYWPTVCDLIKSSLAETNLAPGDIKGIASSSALPSFVIVDHKHRPLQNTFILLDRRASQEVDEIRTQIGEELIFNLTANRLDDHPILVNLLWTKKNRPSILDGAYKVLTPDGYITLRLTGMATGHHSAGPFFGVAYDLRQGQFDEKILTSIGIPHELLPDIFPCEAIVGEVTRQAADDCGLQPGTPVIAGQVDCNASWIGAGAIEEGDIQSNLGSVGNFGIVHQNWDFIFSDVGRLMINFPYTINSRKTLITVPTTLTGGQCVRFIRDNILNFGEIEGLNKRVPSYDDLNLLAEEIPLGCNGLIVLPYLMGERTPIWNNQARGLIFGLSLNHSLGHLVRAMMEGVAFAMYDSFRLIQSAGLKINFPIVMNEGGVISKLWRSIITDVFNVPTVLVKRRTGAPYGDAILAGVATGVIPDFNVTKQWVELIDPIEPNSENHHRYLDIFSLYKQVYEHVKDDYNSLTKLREKYSD